MMRDTIITTILNERAWLTCSMALGAVLVAAWAIRHRGAWLDRAIVQRAMNLFYGCMIGTMGFGHLFAVTIKRLQNTLEPNVALMYLLGVALFVPGWWLAATTLRRQRTDRLETTAVALNAWLAIGLLALGLHNLPLAAPALLNIAYQVNGRRAVGWTIACVALIANVALFVGSVVFWASGKTFEQFRGMQ